MLPFRPLIPALQVMTPSAAKHARRHGTRYRWARWLCTDLLYPAASVLLLLIITGSGNAQEQYPEHPDSKRKAGVPEGIVEGPFDFNQSKIFPGTHRQYWLYIPRQYDASKPACSIFVQDGLNRANDWKLPTVMDNLIDRKEMPVTIGIFISPGVVPAPHQDAQPRFNRSFEYDGLGDAYARFLIEEIIPEVSKNYNLSSDPNDRCLAGASSGGICAFTAAWERPDAFRRVLSTIGTYVNLRGGHLYPSLIRKSESKPLRIFLQDGSNDLDIYAGSWWVANQDMLSALKFSGYDVQHNWGEGGHNGLHAAAIMPDAMRWIWRDYPKPIQNVGGKQRRTDLLIDGEDWKLVSEGHRFTEGPAVNEKGEVYFTDVPNSKIHKIDLNGEVTTFAVDTNRAAGLMFGPDGYLYATTASGIVRLAELTGESEAVVPNANCNDLVVLPDGGYFTDPRNKKVWHVNADGHAQVVDEGIAFPNGVVTSADQTLLHVADSEGRFTYCFQIQPDGTLRHKQRYGYLHTPDDTGQSRADGMTVDREGRLYVATNIGIQVLDQLGRVHFIFASPHNERITNVVFGGANRNELYITVGDKVFKRKINTNGVTPNLGPVKPPKPGL